MPTKLITSIDDLKEHLAIDFISDFGVIEYAVEDRENEIRDTYLGTALFTQLTNYKSSLDNSSSGSSSSSSSGSSSTEKLNQLLYNTQRAVANFAFMDYIPEGQLNISEKGIRIATNTEMKTAFQWQIDQLHDKYKKTGYAAIENMIVHLMENLDTYANWKGTDQHADMAGMFIWSSKDFNKYFNIDDNRVVFRELLPPIKKAQDFYISQAIGQDYYDLLKTSILNNEISAADRIIINMIKPALAHLSIHIAYTEYGSVLTDLMVEYNRAMSNLRDRNNTLGQQTDSAERWGMKYLQKLTDYLDTHATATKYPEYYTYSQQSESYSCADNRFYTNDEDKGIFVM
jgi:hypothetical protein